MFTIKKEDAMNFGKITKILTQKQFSDFIKKLINCGDDCGDINVFESAIPCQTTINKDNKYIEDVIAVMSPHVDMNFVTKFKARSIISYSKKLTIKELDKFLVDGRKENEVWKIVINKHGFIPIRYYLMTKDGNYVTGYSERIH